MTPHPCAGLSRRQREVFEQVALNQQPMAPRTLEALLARGLLRVAERRLGGHPPVVVKEYHVPLPLHMQWCQWASEQGDPDAL